jgi:LmbE family N-acetylglucosaminyl deacetylase
VWAHPDDETYLSAGLMADARRGGDRVVVISATLGDRGTFDGQTRPRHEMARLREAELRAGLAELGVDELRLLGFDDGDCDQVDGTSMVAEHLAELEPDLVITFGPDGMTGHRDHRAVSSWTSEAHRLAAPDAELWWATLDDAFHRRWGTLNDSIGLWADQPRPPCTPGTELVARIELSGPLLAQKLAALRAHRSQTRLLESTVGSEVFEQWWTVESFRAATRVGSEVLV